MATKKKDTATKETAIATIGPELSGFPVLNPAEAEEALDVIRENLGSAGFQIGNLDRITVPPGGGKVFTVNTGDAEECVPKLTGIIVLAPEQNALWAKTMEEAPNDPPICFSGDGIHGTGDPFETGSIETHLCATCPKKAWGTDLKGGKGKACRDLRPIFLLQEGEYLPIIVQTPRMSLKRLSGYFTLLARKGIPYYSVVTEIGLAQEQKSGTPLYSILTFAMKALIPKELRPTIKEFQGALRAHSFTPPIAAEFKEDAGNGEVFQEQYNPFTEEGETPPETS